MIVSAPRCCDLDCLILYVRLTLELIQHKKKALVRGNEFQNVENTCSVE